MKMIKENGFINDNYIVTAIEADCFGESVTFFVVAKKWSSDRWDIDFILCIDIEKYVCCGGVFGSGDSFTIENVTKEAKEYLEDNALEMYTCLKRRLQAEKPSVSFSYYDEDCTEEDEYGFYLSDYRYSEDKMCISIPCSILGEDVCDVINTFDGGYEIAIDKKDKALKIYHSIVEDNNRLKQRYFKTGIKIGETSVRSFLNLDNSKDIFTADVEEEQELYYKDPEEVEKGLKELLRRIENKNEESTNDTEREDVLI